MIEEQSRRTTRNRASAEWLHDAEILKRLVERTRQTNPFQLTWLDHEGPIREAVVIATISSSLSRAQLEPRVVRDRTGYKVYQIAGEATRRALQEELLVELERAALEGARLICLNEMAYPGEPGNDVELQSKIKSLADKYDLFVLAGTYHDPNECYNLCPVFCSSGGPIDPHAKLTSAVLLKERIRVPSGRVMRYYKTRYGKIAVLICLDAYEPGLFLGMMRKNSQYTTEEEIDFVFVPSFSPQASDKMCDACQDLSYSTSSVVVFVNCVDIQPRHVVFIAGKRREVSDPALGYTRTDLSEQTVLHRLEPAEVQTARNRNRDGYSEVFRYILGAPDTDTEKSIGIRHDIRIFDK